MVGRKVWILLPHVVFPKWKNQINRTKQQKPNKQAKNQKKWQNKGSMHHMEVAGLTSRPTCLLLSTTWKEGTNVRHLSWQLHKKTLKQIASIYPCEQIMWNFKGLLVVLYGTKSKLPYPSTPFIPRALGLSQQMERHSREPVSSFHPGNSVHTLYCRKEQAVWTVLIIFTPWYSWKFPQNNHFEPLEGAAKRGDFDIRLFKSYS